MDEFVQEFGENQRKLAILVDKCMSFTKENVNERSWAKILNMRREILVMDLNSQRDKIKKMEEVLNEIVHATE